MVWCLLWLCPVFFGKFLFMSSVLVLLPAILVHTCVFAIRVLGVYFGLFDCSRFGSVFHITSFYVSMWSLSTFRFGLKAGA